jgi:hypothetical protein
MPTAAPTRCPGCAEAIKPDARFCPRCGHAIVEASGGDDNGAGDRDARADSAVRRGRVELREAILGWVFAAAGLGLVLAPFVRSGTTWKSWAGFGVGAVLLLLAIGCLVGKKDGAGK